MLSQLMVLFGFAPVPVERSHLERARELLETHCAARLLDCRLVENEPGETA